MFCKLGSRIRLLNLTYHQPTDCNTVSCFGIQWNKRSKFGSIRVDALQQIWISPRFLHTQNNDNNLKRIWLNNKKTQQLARLCKMRYHSLKSNWRPDSEWLWNECLCFWHRNLCLYVRNQSSSHHLLTDIKIFLLTVDRYSSVSLVILTRCKEMHNLLQISHCGELD